MMIPRRTKRTAAVAALFSATVFQLGFVSSCDDRLVGLTNYIDPCGTILGNCPPGFFQSINADLGDWCLDPACTVPGGCGNADPPLGTIRDICP